MASNPISGFGEMLFGSPDSPDYTGQAPSVESQQAAYSAQDKQKYTQADAQKGIAESVYQPKAETFSQQAINDRAQRQYGDYLGEQKLKGSMQEMDEQQRQRMNNYDYAAKVQRLVKHVQDQKRIAMENQAAARNRVIGNILGVAGAVGGGIAGSALGPAGTFAGASAGGRLGSALGGNQQMQSGAGYQGGGMQLQDPSYGRYGKAGME